jgi:hypothetical protein
MFLGIAAGKHNKNDVRHYFIVGTLHDLTRKSVNLPKPHMENGRVVDQV